jgi:hypothetical protein
MNMHKNARMTPSGRAPSLDRAFKFIAPLEVIAGRLNRSPENFGRRQLD